MNKIVGSGSINKRYGSRSGSARKCHGSPTLVRILYFVLWPWISYIYLCTCCLYCAWRNAFDAGNIHYKGRWREWALKWQRAKWVPFGPKKVKIWGPTLPMARVMDVDRIKIIKSKRHIKKTGTLVLLCTWVSVFCDLCSVFCSVCCKFYVRVNEFHGPPGHPGGAST